jgi:hypothetical protein
MSDHKLSRQRRDRYCLSSSVASQEVSPGLQERSAEQVRQQIIKSYLRRPVLGGPAAGREQPVSVADALEQVERLLDDCDAVAV